MKISMITITYNSEKTLRETIESVLSQGYEDLEYIIVDGKSKDGTMDIVRAYGDKIAKVISEPDKGISDAFNKGLKMATGDVIGIINSDDLLYEGALKAVSECFLAHPTAQVVYGKGKRLYEDGHMRDYLPLPLTAFDYKMPLVHPSTFVKRDAYEKFGGFEEQYKYCMDRAVLLPMYRGGAEFVYLDAYLSYYRMGGVSHKQYLKGTLKEGEKISVRYGMNPVRARITTWYKGARYIAIQMIRKVKK